MKTVILCGGMATRIRELSDSIPKPMVPVGDRPILWHIMKIYDHWDYKQFILCLGYRSEAIKKYFLNYHASVCDITVNTAEHNQVQFHDSEDLEQWQVTLADTGLHTMTGGRVARIARYLEGDEDFMLTYGDGVADINIKELLEFHSQHGKLVTVTGVHPAGRFGELGLDNQQRVKAFAEKPQVSAGRINGGFFVMKREFIDRYLSTDRNLVLEREPLQRCAEDGEMMSYTHDGYWQPMDTFREYKLLNQQWESGDAPWKLWK